MLVSYQLDKSHLSRKSPLFKVQGNIFAISDNFVM